MIALDRSCSNVRLPISKAITRNSQPSDEYLDEQDQDEQPGVADVPIVEVRPSRQTNRSEMK